MLCYCLLFFDHETISVFMTGTYIWNITNTKTGTRKPPDAEYYIWVQMYLYAVIVGCRSHRGATSPRHFPAGPPKLKPSPCGSSPSIFETDWIAAVPPDYYRTKICIVDTDNRDMLWQNRCREVKSPASNIKGHKYRVISPSQITQKKNLVAVL
jgi:hypothetical protein